MNVRRAFKDQKKSRSRAPENGWLRAGGSQQKGKKCSQVISNRVTSDDKREGGGGSASYKVRGPYDMQGPETSP